VLVSGVCYFSVSYLKLSNWHRPTNTEELFNLHHASARNVIEHIFGMLKHFFHILLLSPEYSMEIQACIPAALCAVHNFVGIFDRKYLLVLASPST
jgi:hypothetical protein